MRAALCASVTAKQGEGEKGREKEIEACKSGRGRYCAWNYTSLFCQTLLLLDIYFDLAEAPLLAADVVVPLAVVVVVVVLASSIL